MALGGDRSALELLRRAEHGVLLYGITPPTLTTTPERADEIARATLARLDSVALDGLIIYDVDAESDRSTDARPFPFMPMMDPADFMERHLPGWTRPVLVYRAVGKYTEAELSGWLTEVDADRVLTVLVGAASRHQAVKTRLTDAYRLYAGLDRRPGIGGVCIAERHVGTAQEHRRMLSKQKDGCDFFVSQVCYDLDHSRDLLSDYVYLCRDEDILPRPEVGVQGSGGGGAHGQPPAVGEDPAAAVVAVDGDVVVVDVGVVVVAEQDAAVGGVGAGATGPAAGVGVVAFALAGGCVAAGVHASAVVGVQRPPPGSGEGALGAADVEDLALGVRR